MLKSRIFFLTLPMVTSCMPEPPAGYYETDAPPTDTNANADSDNDADIDGDGYSESEGDCDDSDSSIHPGASDTFGDGVDQNCDGVDGLDADGDGYASEDSGGTDCDDADSTVGDCAACDYQPLPTVALSFDGIDDSIAIGTEPSIVGLGEAITVEAWMRVVDDGDSFCGSILTDLDDRYVHLCYHGYQDWDYAAFGVVTETESGSAVSAEGSVVPGIWHHVAGVYDGVSVRLFMDGELAAETTHSGSILDSESATVIGTNNRNTHYHYEGDLRDVRVWKRALFPQEITCRASGGEPGDQSDQLGAWHMDEGAGTTLTDASGNGLTGTIEGAAWVAY